MSSEESGVDDNGDDILLVKPLPWRSGECNRMFTKIDGYNMACKSPASRRQEAEGYRRQSSRTLCRDQGRSPRLCSGAALTKTLCYKK